MRTKKSPGSEGEDLCVGLFQVNFMYVSEQKNEKLEEVNCKQLLLKHYPKLFHSCKCCILLLLKKLYCPLPNNCFKGP